MLRDDDAGRPLEIERAPVVAETAPRAEDSAVGAAARLSTEGNAVMNVAHCCETREIWVCCAITSDTRIA